MNIHQRQLVALGLGILTYIIFQYIGHELDHILEDNFYIEGQPFPKWASAILNFKTPLIWLIPGFIAGWVAQTRGVLLGFLSGILGSVISLTGMLILAGKSNELLGLFWPMINYELPMALVSGAAGGTAQLMRSNKSLQPTAKDAAG